LPDAGSFELLNFGWRAEGIGFQPPKRLQDFLLGCGRQPFEITLECFGKVNDEGAGIV